MRDRKGKPFSDKTLLQHYSFGHHLLWCWMVPLLPKAVKKRWHHTSGVSLNNNQQIKTVIMVGRRHELSTVWLNSTQNDAESAKRNVCMVFRKGGNSSNMMKYFLTLHSIRYQQSHVFDAMFWFKVWPCYLATFSRMLQQLLAEIW